MHYAGAGSFIAAFKSLKRDKSEKIGLDSQDCYK